MVITTFCATAFLGAAGKYSTWEIGSHRNMDFWFMVQSSAMSLLGFFTAMFPLYRRPWGLPWHWSLALCFVGTVSVLAAVPVYLCAPAFWSSSLLFIGAASQAAVTLQLSLLAMQPASKKKHD